MGTETKTYEVRGMTCEHCLLSVREELAELGGVTVIGLELESGRLEVTGADVGPERIGGAVAEAGYELVAVGS